MTVQTVLLLHGEPGAGKDAIAERLVAKHGFTRFAFADKLKQMCEDLDPIVGVVLDMYGPDHKLITLTEAVERWGWDAAKRELEHVRRTQQRLATEVIRKHVSETFWADHVYDQIVKIAPRPVVVTDMRFQSELDTIADPWGALWDNMDVQTWWVKRPDNPHRIEGDNAAHVSEQWHPERYIEVLNDGTLEELSTFVDAWLYGLDIRRVDR